MESISASQTPTEWNDEAIKSLITFPIKLSSSMLHSDIFDSFIFGLRSALDTRDTVRLWKAIRYKPSTKKWKTFDWKNRLNSIEPNCFPRDGMRRRLTPPQKPCHVEQPLTTHSSQIMILCCVEYLIHFARHTPASAPVHSNTNGRDTYIMILSLVFDKCSDIWYAPPRLIATTT